MGALSQHFEELEEKHKEAVIALEVRILDLEAELSNLKSRYDSLCGKVRKNANDARNYSEGDNFLRSYAATWK